MFIIDNFNNKQQILSMLNSYTVVITIITHSIHHHMLDNCNDMTGTTLMLALYQFSIFPTLCFIT